MKDNISEKKGILEQLDYDEGGREHHYILNSDLSKELYEKLNAWIRGKNFLEKTNVYKLSKELNTNQKYLAFLIKERYNGKKFTEFISSLRINYALSELRKKNTKLRYYSVESLSKHLGFSSKTTFYKVFETYTGSTPANYIRFVNQNTTTT